jgi:hypothetical protein
MQCSIHNQSNGLFIYIINYLHVLYMILMILSCVLYMTLMMFIYVCYRLFTCINLVDVISLFFMVFCSFYQISIKIGWFLIKTVRNLPLRFSKKPTALSVKPAVFRCYRFSPFIRHLRVSTKFSLFLSNFSKIDRI